MNRKASTGFTIVELLIVVVVVAVLAAIVIVAYNGISSRATDTGLKTDLLSQSKKIETEKIKNGVMDATIVSNYLSTTTNTAVIEYKYGDQSGQCLELTTIKTPSRQFYINSSGQESQMLPGTCPTPTGEVSLRCVVGDVVMVVTQKNYMTSDVTIRPSTAYGTSAGAVVTPQNSMSSSFTTRVPSIPAGIATIYISNPTTPSLSTSRFQPYPAYSC